MIKWIHVVTDSKLPTVRGGQSSVYELYEEGFNPNVDTPFGPDKETMFLPVISPAAPIVNEVIEQVVHVMTTGEGGQQYHGEYLDPEWVQSWSVVPQELEMSRELKKLMLDVDRDAFVATGYAVGPFAFPLTEHFFRLLADRLKWLEEAVSALEVPSNTQLTFSDLADKEVSVGLDTLRAHFIGFGKEYLGMYETVVAAADEIKEATTPAQVNVVTWNF